MPTSQLPFNANLSDRLIHENSSNSSQLSQRRNCLFQPFDRCVNASPSTSNDLSNIFLGCSVFTIIFSLIAPDHNPDSLNNPFYALNPPEERIALAVMGTTLLLLALGIKNAVRHHQAQNGAEVAELIQNDVSRVFAL